MKSYSPEMLKAWKRTKAAYERLLFGRENQIGQLRGWQNYGTYDACHLCKVVDTCASIGNDCRNCVLGGVGLWTPCFAMTLSHLECEIWKCGGSVIASAAVMEAAAARYEWLLKRAWTNGVE